jgi:hypothetical protein
LLSPAVADLILVRSMAAIHVWRRVLDAIFGPLERSLEARRARQSYITPVICGAGRDRMRYYNHGRSVDVQAELLVGPIERRIYRSQQLRWRDTGADLSDAEANKVIDAVCRHFDRRKVKWEFWPAQSAAT